MMQAIFQILPERMQGLKELILQEKAEEIRFRMGQPVSLVRRGTEIRTNAAIVESGDIGHILSAASENSLYAVNDSLREGFITIRGGHRIGICGQAVMDGNRVRTLKDISSLSIRIARQWPGIGVSLTESTLILGSPGCGKTTLLRDCIRVLSDVQGQRVSLADERGEVAACVHGKAQMDVGQRTDIMVGCPKSIGVTMMLRAMNPQWIAVDEITREDDVEAIIAASYCGVKLLATAHAMDKDDLFRRPVYRKLMESNIFENFLLMRPDHTFCKGRIVS